MQKYHGGHGTFICIPRILCGYAGYACTQCARISCQISGYLQEFLLERSEVSRRSSRLSPRSPRRRRLTPRGGRRWATLASEWRQPTSTRSSASSPLDFGARPRASRGGRPTSPSFRRAWARRRSGEHCAALLVKTTPHTLTHKITVFSSTAARRYTRARLTGAKYH